MMGAKKRSGDQAGRAISTAGDMLILFSDSNYDAECSQVSAAVSIGFQRLLAASMRPEPTRFIVMVA